ncbi:CRISPR-associated helicase Cas3' [Paracoccus spongiarum]|uniref:CRISPR-associated helicase Cas3 n=1 Tax=Paracoccus spongiarum TaxID=3064387 RepID=A0ABT9J9C0_9RHOB|nr:CRISPR-associated helicase Cas3' [Paracoccus sp. 2205BS29-5]MDP5306426.1 CRISPR-associated helicase Cas3' [Paracoccus sp. 2205BS29-5]
MTIEWIENWPGKSPQEPGGLHHAAVYHMLDVAAVAEVMLATWDMPKHRKEALVLLSALHDLGKIGGAFRDCILNGTPQHFGSHWKVTEALLRHHDALLARVWGDVRQTWRFSLYAATAGHHGRPPRASADEIGRMLDVAGAESLADAASVIQEFSNLWPQASLADLTRDEMIRLSWWLPGLIAAADWIGSNGNWFGAHSPILGPAEYLAKTRPQAASAVEKAGFSWPAASTADLFDFDLRPMQEACSTVALCEGPMLAVIEDETGAGKTEAALILAQRMMAAGKGRGLFFALPTMATADAMFLRNRDCVGRMFESGPSLTLAHGRAGLSVGFRDLIGRDRPSPDEPGCSEWLAEDRRRALLADVGVGTVDQALLAVLPTRHSCLRLYGLSSKILIVDEVHEMGDPYLQELLVTLLSIHAAMGGSAILLTATLPLGLRARLVAAFEDGADRPAAPLTDRAYPALTVVGGGAPELPCHTGDRGAVRVRRIGSPEEVVDLLATQVAEGAACVWIRNAVDEAIAAVQALREKGVVADVLHARFALADRKRHEALALDLFGKSSKDRGARVLVGTQILESSLDLDFDVMVSDLAPMAALIQRMGRLWRHMDLRPHGSRSVPEPVLHVLSADPEDVRDARWLQPVLGAGAHVYPPGLQWRTADVLFRAGKIEPPGDLRGLIEAVHGLDAGDVPAALVRAEMEAEGKDHAARAQGERNKLDFALGYRDGAEGWEDSEFPTRLGQPVLRLVLARWQAGRLTPWAEGETLADSLALSELTAAAARLASSGLPDQGAPEIVAFTTGWPDWRRKAVTVCPVNQDGRIAEGLHYSGKEGLLFSSPAARG